MVKMNIFLAVLFVGTGEYATAGIFCRKVFYSIL